MYLKTRYPPQNIHGYEKRSPYPPIRYCGPILFAQQKNIKKTDGGLISTRFIDQTAKKLMDTAGVTGLCIGVINDNQPAYVQAYGYKNKAKNELNDTTTSLYAASLAKPLFGYIVVQLAQEGVINLDKPLCTYLPKPIPEYDNCKDLSGDDRWKFITARHCLSHTSGFPNWRNSDANNFQKMGIIFTPGTHYSYSGEGIMLLQMVVEIITHRNLEDLAREKVFVPLHMTKTSFVWQPRFETDYANGHGIEEDTLPKDRYKQPFAAGSMETTIADYTRFIAGVMQKKNLSDKFWNEMLSQIAINSKKQIFSLNTADTTRDNDAIQLSYGLGCGLFKTPYGRAFFKEGHGVGWVHYMIADPEKKTALIIMSNSASGESIFTELVQKLTGVTIPSYWENYFPYRGTAKLSAEQLKQFEGVWEGAQYTATVTLVNGKLKVEAPKVNMPPTAFYPQNDHHLFLRVMEADFEFVKGPDGRFDKAIADDEGEHYELKRIK
jgi:CubicO group peptidase (beta-lactamase class C family)